jgi:6,7-dimethyl-8-ribityllumazine synthase
MKKEAKTIYEGHYDAKGLKIGIVCARFNDLITKELLAGAMDSIVRHGGSIDNVAVAWVPGSYELPLIAQKFASSGDYDAVIALGVVIQGSTAHADYVNGPVANGLSAVGRETGIPVIYGVVTTETIEQAIERSGTKLGNRGFSAAQTAIEMANLIKAIDK